MNDTSLSAIKILLVVVGSVCTTFFNMNDVKVATAVSLASTAIPALWLLIDQIRHKQAVINAVNAGITLSNQTAAPTPLVTTTAEAHAVIQQSEEGSVS